MPLTTFNKNFAVGPATLTSLKTLVLADAIEYHAGSSTIASSGLDANTLVHKCEGSIRFLPGGDSSPSYCEIEGDGLSKRLIVHRVESPETSLNLVGGTSGVVLASNDGSGNMLACTPTQLEAFKKLVCLKGAQFGGGLTTFFGGVLFENENTFNKKQNFKFKVLLNNETLQSSYNLSAMDSSTHGLMCRTEAASCGCLTLRAQPLS